MLTCALAHAEDNELFDREAPKFFRAFHEGSVIKFYPPSNIKWEALAPAKIREINLGIPDKDTLAYLNQHPSAFGWATINYVSSLPDTIKNTFYYLIGPNGGIPLTPKMLLGEALFKIDRKQNKVYRRSFYGYVTGEAINSANGKSVGFVVSSTKEIVFSVEDGTISKDALINASDLKVKNKEFWKILKNYHFRVANTGELYTFIQWAPDTDCVQLCCENRYSIYSNKDKVKLVAYNYYNCDI